MSHTEDGKAYGALVAISVLEPFRGHPGDEYGTMLIHYARVDVIEWTDGIRDWSRRMRLKGEGGPLLETPTGCSVMIAVKQCAALDDITSKIARMESMIPKGKVMDMLVAEVAEAVGIPLGKKAA